MADATSSAAIARPEPYGIGGWLIFPMLGTCVAPLINIKTLVETLELIAGPQFQTYAMSFKIFAYVELLAVLAMVCAWILAIVFLFKHKRQYPILFNWLLVITFAVSAGELLYLYKIYGVAADTSDIRNVGRNFMGMMIWAPYMMNSKRVANTFVY